MVAKVLNTQLRDLETTFESILTSLVYNTLSSFLAGIIFSILCPNIIVHVLPGAACGKAESLTGTVPFPLINLTLSIHFLQQGIANATARVVLTM